MRRLTALATEKYDCSVGQLALAWCIKNKNVSTVLLGATKPEQLVENLGCLSVVDKITAEGMKEIEDILDNKPKAYNGYGGEGMRSI